MTISIPAKSLVAVGAYHAKEPVAPYDDTRPDGFFVTVGTSNAWVSEEDAARLARYLLGQPESVLEVAGGVGNFVG